jgi:hypothetical protein
MEDTSAANNLLLPASMVDRRLSTITASTSNSMSDINNMDMAATAVVMAAQELISESDGNNVEDQDGSVPASKPSTVGEIKTVTESRATTADVLKSKPISMPGFQYFDIAGTSPLTSVDGQPVPPDATTYLEQEIFPTLLPALEKLLKAVKRHEAEDAANFDPINWLAQVSRFYIMMIFYK